MNKHIIRNTLLMGFVFTFFANVSLAQSNETLAKELFENKEFNEALPHFKELHKLYPDEAMFQYYYGVCLTETHQFGLNTRKLLLQSAQKKVPNNVFFYIAKNYHAVNNYDTALQYYERFDDYARNREKRKVNFKEIYNLCLNEENPFLKKETKPEPFPATPKTEITQSDSTIVKHTPDNSTSDKMDQGSTTNPQILKKEKEKRAIPNIPKNLNDSLINFSVAGRINYLNFKQFKTTEGKIAFLEGVRYNRKLKQIIKTTDSLRSVYNNTKNSEEKEDIANSVIDLELETIKLRSLADNAFNNARKKEIEYWNETSDHALATLIKENDSIRKAQQKKSSQQKNRETPQKLNIISDSTEMKITEPDSTIQKNTPQQPKAENKADKANNIRYKVQIGAYSKGLPAYVDRMYNKLSVLRKIDHYTDENGIVVYTVGNVDNFEDALQLQKQIRQEGIKDAFVVAYNNGKRITLSEAREIQKND